MNKQWTHILSWRRLRIQAILIALLTLIVALGGFTALMVKQQRDRLLELSLNESDALARNTAGTIVEWMLNSDFDKLSEAAMRTAEYSRVISIKVISIDGIPVATIERNAAGEIKEVFTADPETLPRAGHKHLLQSNRIVSWAPIEAEQKIGWVKLSYSIDELNKMKAHLWKQGLTFLCLFVLLAIVVFWRFFDGPLKAIEKITEFSSQMTGAHVEPLLIKHRTRETEKLANTLNKTSKTLYENLMELRASKLQLEARVEERTKDLAKTVNQLKHEMEERKKVETQLLHAQKMESVGQLAAGVAHEINTPIQFVTDNLQFIDDAKRDLFEIIAEIKKIMDRFESGESTEAHLTKLKAIIAENDLEFIEDELPSAIQQSLDGTERVTKIVQAMKSFSHPSTDEMAKIDLNQAVSDTVTLTRNEWKYIADLDLKLHQPLPEVTCCPGELNQVVLNLIVNASHAIEDAKNANPDLKGQIVVSTVLLDDEQVQINVQDNGTGIPQHAQNKIFDPFFTTKKLGKGTGQGLSICYDAIVNGHQGQLTFDTEEGTGTTFRITIPMTPQEALKS